MIKCGYGNGGEIPELLWEKRFLEDCMTNGGTRRCITAGKVR